MRRLLVVVGAVALALVGTVPASATSEGHGYLALGDSVAFGTNPLLDASNAANFTGYPEIVARTLNIEDVNASCPGEATGSFLSAGGLDNVCRPYKAAFPLHIGRFSGLQLDFAVNYLRQNPRTRLVTIDLGANDFFRLTSGPGSPWPPAGCYTPDLATYFTTCAVQNLEAIFAALRATGYTGLIVGLTYYALDYSDPAGLGVGALLNGAMITAAKPYGVLIASGFDAFKGPSLAAGGSSCAAGLRIPLPGGGCDIHPSPAGRDLLAQAVVNTIAGSCNGSAIGCLNRNRG